MEENVMTCKPTVSCANALMRKKAIVISPMPRSTKYPDNNPVIGRNNNGIPSSPAQSIVPQAVNAPQITPPI